MFTIAYKGHYIHGYCKKDECEVLGVKYKSFRAAQIAITKLIKGANDAS